MITRDDVPFYVSVLMGDRPVRWAPPELRRGDYDGRECTLEVFLADAREQLGLLEAIGEDDWAKIEAAAGGPVVYIFHTERYAACASAAVNTPTASGSSASRPESGQRR